MAGVLRRLHRAGIRKGFFVVAPTSLGGDPRVDPSDGGPKDKGDVQWWSGICDRIRSETGLSMVLVNAPCRGPEAERVLSNVRLGKGVAVLDDLTTRERSALLEVSRGVCTGDRNLLAEARAGDARLRAVGGPDGDPERSGARPFHDSGSADASGHSLTTQPLATPVEWRLDASKQLR